MSGLPTDLTLTVIMACLLAIVGLFLYLKGSIDEILRRLDVSDSHD